MQWLSEKHFDPLLQKQQNGTWQISVVYRKSSYSPENWKSLPELAGINALMSGFTVRRIDLAIVGGQADNVTDLFSALKCDGMVQEARQLHIRAQPAAWEQTYREFRFLPTGFAYGLKDLSLAGPFNLKVYKRIAETCPNLTSLTVKSDSTGYGQPNCECRLDLRSIAQGLSRLVNLEELSLLTTGVQDMDSQATITTLQDALPSQLPRNITLPRLVSLEVITYARIPEEDVFLLSAVIHKIAPTACSLVVTRTETMPYRKQAQSESAVITERVIKLREDFDRTAAIFSSSDHLPLTEMKDLLRENLETLKADVDKAVKEGIEEGVQKRLRQEVAQYLQDNPQPSVAQDCMCSSLSTSAPLSHRQNGLMRVWESTMAKLRRD